MPVSERECTPRTCGRLHSRAAEVVASDRRRGARHNRGADHLAAVGSSEKRFEWSVSRRSGRSGLGGGCRSGLGGGCLHLLRGLLGLLLRGLLHFLLRGRLLHGRRSLLDRSSGRGGLGGGGRGGGGSVGREGRGSRDEGEGDERAQDLLHWVFLSLDRSGLEPARMKPARSKVRACRPCARRRAFHAGDGDRGGESLPRPGRRRPIGPQSEAIGPVSASVSEWTRRVNSARGRAAPPDDRVPGVVPSRLTACRRGSRWKRATTLPPTPGRAAVRRCRMSHISIRPQRKGDRLAVLMPGLGAVATTAIAGVEAVKRGLAEPIGSLTQLGHVIEEDGSFGPPLRDLIPMPALDELVFGGWDPIPDSAYEAARRAKVLDHHLVDQLVIE